MLNSTHNLTGLQLGDIDRGGGGEKVPLSNHILLIQQMIPPFTYRKLSCLFHSYKIHLLGPSADRNDRFPYFIL